MRCAIVGAGVAGLVAARRLHAAGASVTVFDKGRRAGGRLASRETAFGSFDHGAARLSLRDPLAIGLSQAWRDAALLQAWSALDATTHGAAWVGAPDMNALARAAAQTIDVRCAHTVREIAGGAGQWSLHFDTQAPEAGFDQVLITTPAPQALAWLGAGPLRAPLAAIRYQPCLSLMWVPAATVLPKLAADQPVLETGLALIAREDLKPGRGGTPRYTVQASAAWSAAHLEWDARAQREALLDLAARWLGLRPGALHADLHRWRYAQVERPAGAPALHDGEGLTFAGDGCLAGGVEGALLSGWAAAGAMLGAPFARSAPEALLET